MKIEWVGTPNYRQGRSGNQVFAIINHITAGRYPGCLSWMQNPASQASSHYLVLKDGRIMQLVKDEDTAWHAGLVNKPNWKLYNGKNPNLYTIGIEHEALEGEGLTDAQYQSTLWLHGQLLAKFPAIKPDSDHIIGHYRTDSVNRPNDPGAKFLWEQLFKDLKSKDLKGEEDMVDNLVIYADGDVGAALILSQKLGCPMVHKNSSNKYQAAQKHWVGVQGTNDSGNSYYAGANRTETARAVLK